MKFTKMNQKDNYLKKLRNINLFKIGRNLINGKFRYKDNYIINNKKYRNQLLLRKGSLGNYCLLILVISCFSLKDVSIKLLLLKKV